MRRQFVTRIRFNCQRHVLNRIYMWCLKKKKPNLQIRRDINSRVHCVTVKYRLTTEWMDDGRGSFEIAIVIPVTSSYSRTVFYEINTRDTFERVYSNQVISI